MGRPEGREKVASVNTIEYAASSAFTPSIEYPEPEFKPKYSVFKEPRLWWNYNYLSWRFYVTIYAFLALLVCFTILTGLVIAIGIHGVDKKGKITVYDGTASGARWKSLGAHFFISGMGTYMLSASAYVMYCLSPPSREEIDKEHSQGRWLDIGAMSIRNLLRINKKRSGMFLLLALTSPFVQLFFNAILFQTHSSNAYSVLVAQESFLKPGNFTMRLAEDIDKSMPVDNFFNEIAIDMHEKALAGKLDKLDNKECIDAYAVPLQFARRNVVIVTKNNSSRLADVFDGYEAPLPTPTDRDGPEQYYWLCHKLKLKGNDQCLYHTEHLRLDSTLWTISDGAKIQYCLSEKVEEHIKLQFSLTFSLVVFFVCLFKSVLMLAVAFFTYETPLMSTGDAISSFMQRPDRYTKNMCMASKQFVVNHTGRWRKSAPAHYVVKPKRWYEGIRSRIVVCLLLMVLIICFCIAIYTTSNELITFDSLIALGFGGINQRFFIGWHQKEQGNITRSVFLSNIGHVLFGCIYILYNNVFYTIIFQDEWSRFAQHRKGLRVSESPRGKQRPVYFFLMPNKIAFPIMFFSCAIHTCISQSLFLVDVEAWGSEFHTYAVKSTSHERQPQNDFTTTGFSPLANIGLIFFCFVMIGYLVYMSTCRKFKSGMPVVSTCSAAISAACHPSPDEESDPQLQELQWGVTSVTEGVGHCTFTARAVQAPDERTPYQ